MPSKRAINYARIDGIYHNELPAAIVFTVVYAPFLIIYLIRGIRQPIHVFRSLCIFCVVRIVGFAMRAALAGNESAGQNVNVVVAQMVIYNIGFAGLVYSAYTLVLDRDKLTNPERREGGGLFSMFNRIIRSRILIRLAITAAIVTGIVGGVEQADVSNHDAQETGNTLRKISLYIFLVIVCLLVIITVNLTFDERAAGVWYRKDASYWRQYEILVLLFIALLSVVREVYLIATTGNTEKQNKPALWYPLVACTELVCVALFMVPGLVPSKQEFLASAGLRGRNELQEIPLTYPRI